VFFNSLKARSFADFYKTSSSTGYCIMAGRTYTLNQIYFYLTEGCNLACRHCWLAPQYDSDGTRCPTLPVSLFETALLDGKKLGLKSVKLTGGEPLLHPEIFRILEIVRREELELNIETNGLLCTPEIAAEIAKLPRRFLSVSIDGADAATHDSVRGVTGAFAAACRGIKNLVACGIKPQIIMSIMHCNAGQVDDVLRLAESLGAASLKFNLVQPTARGEKLHKSDETLSIAELLELGRHVERDLAPATKTLLHYDYPQAFRSLGRIASGSGSCGIKGIIGVIASGHYALCGIGKHIPEFVFGEVGRDSLEDIWEHNAMLHSIRDGVPDRLSGVCGRCLMKTRCMGTCIAQNYYRSKNIYAPFWFCEIAEKEGRFPASRLAAV